MSDAQMIRNYRSRSLWLDSALEGQSIRPSLEESIRADVVIVGGGMTGIWTAYTLAVEAPELSVVVVEREIVGFGASGRNGSWLTHDLPGSPKVYAKERGWDSVRAAAAECRNAISEVGRVVEEESIDCAFTHAGTLWYAADEPQAQRLSGYLGMLDKYGLAGPGDIRLTGEEVQQRVAVARSEMGHYSPHCASANPARLVRGVAEAAERRGVRIFENTAVTELQQGRVVTESGAVEADEIVLATEAWTPQLPGYRLTSLPLSSMMVATEPLPAETWEKIGWPRGLTVRDKAHLFLYAVRTEDDRIAIGGRGSPYRLSNPYEEFGERDQPVWDRIRRTIYQQFPAADGAAITHRWGGLLGVPRDWSMGIRRNQEMRITQAGGYAGHGVTATNISGRTIADLLLGRDTELTRLPWVNHRLRRWEPEPARYFAANSIVKLLGSADRHEKEHAKSAKRVSLVKPFMPPG